MKVILFSIFFLNIVFYANCQENGLKIKINDEDDSLGILNMNENIDNFYFHRLPINPTIYKSQIRISLPGQEIDFFSLDGKNYQGLLTNFILEFNNKNKNDIYYNRKEVFKFIYEEIKLENNIVEKMVENLLSINQLVLPTNNLITGWQSDFSNSYKNCNAIIFQFNINENYTRQIFHCPWYQKDTVKFKNLILKNLDSLYTKFQLDTLYYLFEKKLPKGKTYTKDGISFSYLYTEQEYDFLQKIKLNKDKINSIKEKVNCLINDNPKNLKNNLRNIPYLEFYFLNFRKNGKLKKIKTSNYNTNYQNNSQHIEKKSLKKSESREKKSNIKMLFNGDEMEVEMLIYKSYDVLFKD
jgi:hypothetical protein